jgi:hypothetical protein
MKRLLCNMAVNGEMDLASQAFRPVAERMAAEPLAQRRSIADDWLSSCPDAEAIKQTVAIVNPEAPPPVDQTTGAASIGPKAKLICAADIAPRDVEWLWPGRVPLGMLTLFAGDAKLGKSYVTLAVAAAVSRGAPLPGGDAPNGPGSVIIMSAEDDAARTIVPRLMADGATLAKVHILESVILTNGLEALPSLSVDIEALERSVAEIGDSRLIVIDPVSAYLGRTDDHKNAELRGVLSPLKAMAERLNVAVILVTHLNKSAATNGKYRVIGSVAYVGACRANFLFVRDRSDPTGRRVLMCDNGGNLAPTAPTLAYVIEDRGDGPRVEWLAEPVEITAEQALNAEAEAATDQNHALERREAGQWLREVLAKGPVLAKEVEDAARECGIAIRTLKRAKGSIGVESYKEGFGKEAKWYWRLPDARADWSDGP